MSKGIRGARALTLVKAALANSRLMPYQTDMIVRLEKRNKTAVIDFPPMLGKTLKSDTWTKEDKDTMISGLTEIQGLLSPIVERANGGEEVSIAFTPEPTVRRVDMRDVTVTARYELPKSWDDLSDIEKGIIQ